ncbi:MAG: UvrD-helicase domain-containing protein [Candidatus Omnitrophica bacterium]|nr:UvrD-helicase domain-containing protein [Candidatus Omnitrophota bacterium]MCM8825959.1 UvrD-helicase domain-containing protein [Candidatus Omnitrophota bacterium]
MSTIKHKLSFPEVVMVESSAGGGKTYALAKRYLTLLINPYLSADEVPLKNILAITFTNKATVEMKGRILDLLKKIALDAFSSIDEEKDILDNLGVDKDFAMKKAHKVLHEIVRHYNFFSIQTIDSFVNSLLSGCALHIERSANFTVKKDYTELISYCLDLAIEEAFYKEELYKILEEFLRHYLFVENKSGWFPKEDIKRLMQFLFSLSNRYGKLFKTYEGNSNEIVKKKKVILNSMKRLSLCLPSGLNGQIKRSIFSFLQKNKDLFEISELPKAFVQLVPPMNKNFLSDSKFEKKWRRLSSMIRELVELDSLLAYNPYIKLFHRIVELFKVVAVKEDVIFLEELNSKTYQLLEGKEISLPELYYRLAVRFNHYLIDEFQDTSLLQWKNLEAMIEDALSRGGSLFYVGDKKQAIYRFRGGESNLFDEVRNRFIQFNVREERLTKNWRSQKEIVEFNNLIFSPDNIADFLKVSGISEELNNQEEIIKEIIENFKDSFQNYDEKNKFGYVEVERLNEEDREERNELIRDKIVSLIRDLRERFKYKDIAVLTRDNDEVQLITSWLMEENIPVESEKTLNVIEQPLIKELISLLKFLYSPIDDLSFAGFILGDIFRELTSLSYQELAEFIFSSYRKQKINSQLPLYRLFRDKYPQHWDNYIEYFFKIVGFIPLYDLIVRIYQKYSFYDRFKGYEVFFLKFLEVIKSKEEEYRDIGEFIDYLKIAPKEDLYVNLVGRDSVKVLTIHKSKGLEFDVVIIPFLRIDITPQIVKGLHSYIDTTSLENVGLIKITKMHREYSFNLNKVYINNYKNACIDELNTLYVAFTRPRYELYIFIPKKSSGNFNKANYLIPDLFAKSGRKIVYDKGEEKTKQILIKPQNLQHKDWWEKVREEFIDIDYFKDRERILKGEMLHYALSFIDNLNKEDKSILIKMTIGSLRAKYPFVSDLQEYENILNNILNSEILKPFFYIPDGRVYKEKEIVNRFGETKRIDRMIIRGKQIWIIDYKSSQENLEEHKKQVKEYIDIVKDIYPNYDVKGFIVYLDEIKVVTID